MSNNGSSSISVLRDSSVVGIEGWPSTKGPQLTATIVRDVLFRADNEPAILLDIAGRNVMSLRPGENDIRHLSPGVYFVCGKGLRGEPSDGTCENAEQGAEAPSAKVVVQH